MEGAFQGLALSRGPVIWEMGSVWLFTAYALLAGSEKGKDISAPRNKTVPILLSVPSPLHPISHPGVKGTV